MVFKRKTNISKNTQKIFFLIIEFNSFVKKTKIYKIRNIHTDV